MANTAKLDVLAIAAHPDDIEITCGGLLIKMARQGRKTGALDLTRGEMGTHGDKYERDSEADAASKIMQLSYRHNLSLPDSALEYDYESKLKIVSIIRETQPELVILPHWEQRHPDHLSCSRLGYDACFLAGLKKIKADGEPFRPRKIIYASYYRNRDFSFLVDISDEFKQKLEAIAAYESQFGDAENLKDIMSRGMNAFDPIDEDTKNIFHPGVGIFDLMYTRARNLGQMARVKFAEAYTIKETILIDDPQKMPVPSV